VFIGVNLDKHGVRTRLDTALLTDSELAEGPSAWQAYPDPLPAWELVHNH
jgi:hypothetical protein